MFKSTAVLTVAVLTAAGLTFGGGTVVYQHFAKASELKEETAKRIGSSVIYRLEVEEQMLEHELEDKERALEQIEYRHQSGIQFPSDTIRKARLEADLGVLLERQSEIQTIQTQQVK